MEYSENGSMLNTVLILAVLLIWTLLPSVSFASPIYVRQVEGSKMKNFQELSLPGHKGKGDDSDGGMYFGVPSFFMFPFSNNLFFRSASVLSAETSLLQTLLFTTGTVTLLGFMYGN